MKKVVVVPETQGTTIVYFYPLSLLPGFPGGFHFLRGYSDCYFLRCSRSPLLPIEIVNWTKYVLKNHWNRNWIAHKLGVLVTKPENYSLSVVLTQCAFKYLIENYTASTAVPLQRYETAMLQCSVWGTILGDR